MSNEHGETDDGGWRDDTADDGAGSVLSDDELALLLAAPELWALPEDDLEERIVAAIAAERAAGIVAPASPVDPSSTSVAAPSEPPSATIVHLDTARRRRQRWLAPAAAALAGAAAAAVITIAVVPRDDAPPTADATIALTATDPALAISGTAEVTTERSGVRIVIRAPGLPRRDGGEFYQGWLKNCDSTELVPIGSFHELDEAIGWAGIDIDTHPLLTVTRESVAAPKDPLQGSSGDVVVSGVLSPDACPTG